ncbi:uncharacterized protein LOC105441485 [Strongylocentrotus purpuratus]|uniref:FHA domain-containing protein n=1 Tax=Strongylocentrotus purpuratus TaxID=7668 RepID=A0A7M7T3W9_STRPU|nr:uncharacterized protein LOC105441485 [Strongylocentrotus purpuratus]XP_030851997.1 uncharacterized protein LOC105441485 [Strongylocentrotus purpuratus]
MYGRNKHQSAQGKMKAQRQEEQQSDHPGTTKRRRKIQGSRKKGYPAQIIMKEVLRFPQFQLNKEEASSPYARGVKSREVREAIRSSTQLVTEHRIYISVPKDEDHKNKHPIGMLTRFLNPLNKDLITKVQELVGHGVTNVKEMKRHLKVFVDTILFPNPKSRSTSNDMAYYPSDLCVRNHIYAARMKLSMKADILKDRLEESEMLMKEMSLSWEEKLVNTERIHKERQAALEQMGISVQTSGIKVERNKCFLVNLNADPSLNELLVYYLKDHNVAGRADEETQTDIQLNGLGIMPRHCTIDVHVENDIDVYISPCENAKVYVNGSAVTSKTSLRHGDRILLGNYHFFRINCPKSSWSWIKWNNNP